jgi:hypothetical protein
MGCQLANDASAEGVGAGLPTIWREAAANTGHAVSQEE